MMLTLRPEIWLGRLRGISYRAVLLRCTAAAGLLAARFGGRRVPDALARSGSLYRQGKAYYQARDYPRARATFHQLLQFVPSNGGAWYYLGRSSWIAGDFAGALDEFRKAAAFSPENSNARAWLRRAELRVAKQSGQPPPEDTDCEALLEDFSLAPESDWRETAAAREEAPESALDIMQPSLALARRLLAGGAAEDALAVCEALPAAEAGGYAARALIARIHLRQEAFAAALGQFGAVMAADAPVFFRAAFAETLLAAAISRKLEPKRCLPPGIAWEQIPELAAMLDAAQEPLGAFALRRVIWMRSNKFDHVKEAVLPLLAAGHGAAAALFLRELQAEIPDNKSVYLLQADLFVAQNRFAEAKRVLLEGVRELPGEAAILIKLAKLFAESGRWAEAIKSWREAAEAAPKTPNILVEIADCYRKSAQYEKAVQEYRVALNRYPGNEKVYRGLSQSLRRLGRQHDAIAVLRKLVEIAPRNFDNWNELIYTLARAEIGQEALAALDAAETMLGSDLPTIRKLVLSAERALMTDEAEALLKRIITERPDTPEPIVELGRHYHRQGLLGRAEAAFRRAVAQGADPQTLAAEFDHIAHVRDILEVEDPHHDLILPEDAIKYIAAHRREFRRPPRPGRVAIVTTKLASGGAERQTCITATSVRARNEVISGLAMHCLSLSAERGHDFYLPLLQDHPIDVTIPWAADLAEALESPELADYAELIRLLPPDLGFTVAYWTVEFLRGQPEVVHAWQDSAAIGGAIAAILAGVPRIVLSTRNTRPDNKYRRWKRYMFDAYNAFHQQGIILSNNSKAGGLDYDDWLKLPAGTTEIVYNGVDFSLLDADRDALSPAEIKARLGIPENAMIMGGVFRLSGEKQPLLWVETAAIVAKRFPDMHFIICGKGTMREEILALGARLGIGDRLHLPGNQRPIAPWYCAMDIFLLASKKEGLPNVLLEAQYLNVPVVATDVGGVREVMDNGVSGWTVTEQQAEMLADRVIFSLENRDWHQNARQAGRAYVKQTFSVSTMCNRTLEVYGYDNGLKRKASAEQALVA